MQKGTRIQTNDNAFIKQFTQRCTGHDHGHSPVEGGQVVRDTAFYPKRFCQRVVQIWKGDDAKTPKRILQKFEEARLAEETLYICSGCNSRNPGSFPTCPTCKPEEFYDVMPAVHELMKDIPDDDEGPAEQSMERRLQRVHRNLGHPPNRLLVQILKEAKAPDSVIEIAKKLECPLCARYVRTSPARPANPFRSRELGHTVAMDFSYHTTPDRTKLVVLHFVDEASKYHTAKKSSEKAELIITLTLETVTRLI